MIEKVYHLTQGDAKTIEKVVLEFLLLLTSNV